MQTEILAHQQTEVQILSNKFSKLGDTISLMITKFVSDKKELIESIESWAFLMRDILKATNKEEEISNISRLLIGYLKTKDIDYKTAQRFVFEGLEKYPEFNELGREEDSVYYDNLIESLRKIQKLDYSKLTEDQSRKLGKKLDQINRSKLNELKTEHSIDIKKEDEQPEIYDEYETKKITTKRATDSPHPSKITQKFQEIRDLFNILVNRSMYYPPPTKDIENKMCNSADHFIRQLKLITDEKSKITFTDWCNIATISDMYKVNAGHSLVEFPAPLCPTCKDIDTDLDAMGRKKIYKHLDMRLEYCDNFTRVDKDGNPIPIEQQDTYVYRCPRCKGTDMLMIQLTHERIASNYKFILKTMVQQVNKPGIFNALEIYSKSCEQPYKMATSKEVSNKLLSK